MTKWYDKPLLDTYARPALEAVGGPTAAGLYTAGLSLPLFLYITTRGRLNHPKLRAAAASTALGLGAYYGTKPSVEGVDTPKKWADMFLPKTAADALSTPLNKATLFQAIADMPGFNAPQKAFLEHGVYVAPSRDSAALTTLADLADGFSNSVNTVTGGKVGYVTRAVEGALVGSAFSHIMGLSPRARNWTTGISATADALYGNKLIQTIGTLN